MAKQNKSLTWNSISDELRQLIKDRLGVPMALDAATTKGGSYPLDEAIAISLLYKKSIMNNNALNISLTHRLFPEIWPSASLLCKACLSELENFPESKACLMKSVPGCSEHCGHFQCDERCQRTVTPVVEKVDGPATYCITLEHSGDAAYVKKLVDLCYSLTQNTARITTPINEIFNGRIVIELKDQPTYLFLFAMQIAVIDFGKVYSVIVK